MQTYETDSVPRVSAISVVVGALLSQRCHFTKHMLLPLWHQAVLNWITDVYCCWVGVAVVAVVLGTVVSDPLSRTRYCSRKLFVLHQLPPLHICADFYSVSVPPPVLPQWHVKDSDHSAKSAGGRLHLNTHVFA